MHEPSQGTVNLILHISNAALVIGIILSAVGTVGSIWATDALNRSADFRISKNEAETAAANQRAAEANSQLALTNERILAERRLTANERWRLARVEKAVLPRALPPDMAVALIAALKAEHFKPVNVAYVDETEPMLYANSLAGALKEAGIQGHLIRLPKTSQQSGVSFWKANSEGERLARLLWQNFQIGGGVVAGIGPIGWETIPKDTNCLVVGENNAAMQPMDGQPGEGLDEHGVPVPAP